MVDMQCALGSPAKLQSSRSRAWGSRPQKKHGNELKHLVLGRRASSRRSVKVSGSQAVKNFPVGSIRFCSKTVRWFPI